MFRGSFGFLSGSLFLSPGLVNFDLKESKVGGIQGKCPELEALRRSGARPEEEVAMEERACGSYEAHEELYVAPDADEPEEGGEVELWVGEV